MAQGQAIPEPIRWIVIRLSTVAGMSVKDIAMYTSISEASTRKILAYFARTGSVDVPKRSTPARRILSDYDIEHLHRALGETPDLYLDEMRLDLLAMRGVSVSASTIWRNLIRSGYSMKKLTKVAIERSAEKRAEFGARIGTYEANQLVFVDESSVDRRTTYRGRAWSVRGRQATRMAFFCRGRRFSVLPALCLSEGILHCDIIEGSFDTTLFYTFIVRLLDRMQPFPAPNSVIVMDNCRIHKHSDILELIESRGMRYEFLPPYSPDYNPIELAFSAMKYRLRRNGQLVRLVMTELSDIDIYCILLEAVCQMTLADVFGWFRHCGYV